MRLRDRLFGLLLEEALALAPVAAFWWLAVMDADDREAALDRLHDLLDRLTGADLRDWHDTWSESPEAAFALNRRAAMQAAEDDAPEWADPGLRSHEVLRDLIGVLEREEARLELDLEAAEADAWDGAERAFGAAGC